ncbi:hypothetical protein [Sphingomonas sp. YL-JM2C]
MLDLDEMRGLAQAAVTDMGTPLSLAEEAMIRLAVAVSVTSLDAAAVRETIAAALDAGVTVDEAQEIVSLISGLGVHSLMISATILMEEAGTRESAPSDALSSEQQALWDRHVGNDPFWIGFERELPGFLRSMLRLSPAQFTAFFDYCAVPWRGGRVRARIKELAAMASDATPTHRFLPGFRLHLANAIALGAGRLAIERTLELAAAAPPHSGTR